jgi:hypothetical protein
VTYLTNAEWGELFGDVEEPRRDSRVDAGRACGICGGSGGEFVTIVDDDGGSGVAGCEECLGRLDAGDGCALCDESASGEYRVAFAPDAWDVGDYTVCAGCRSRWIIEEDEALPDRLRRLDVRRFGGEVSP